VLLLLLPLPPLLPLLLPLLLPPPRVTRSITLNTCDAQCNDAPVWRHAVCVAARAARVCGCGRALLRDTRRQGPSTRRSTRHTAHVTPYRAVIGIE
jgi:hypothetical protein